MMKVALKLNSESSVAPYRQILEQLAAAILAGTLATGEQLPSVREMAGELRVNPLTVARALNELEGLGLIESRWGKGNFVREITAAQRELARKKAFGLVLREFMEAARRLGFSAEDAARAVKGA